MGSLVTVLLSLNHLLNNNKNKIKNSIINSTSPAGRLAAAQMDPAVLLPKEYMMDVSEALPNLADELVHNQTNEELDIEQKEKILQELQVT